MQEIVNRNDSRPWGPSTGQNVTQSSSYVNCDPPLAATRTESLDGDDRDEAHLEAPRRRTQPMAAVAVPTARPATAFRWQVTAPRSWRNQLSIVIL